MPSSSPLLPLLLVLLYLPPSLASITMCGQDYDSVGCGRINNVQFGFIVAIPLIIPALIFYAVRYKGETRREDMEWRGGWGRGGRANRDDTATVAK